MVRRADSPVWAHSGKELFYRSTAEKLMTVAVRPGSHLLI
jgi:hypothetical protein